MSLQTIPPMSLPRALLFFGLPLLMMAGIFWGVIPLFDLMGVRLFNTWMIALSLPMAILLLLALRFYTKEGHPWSLDRFRERFRLRPMTGADWLWTILAAGFLLGSRRVLAFTTGWISEKIPEPKFLIRMLEEDPNYFMEMSMHGNWLLFGETLFIVLLVVLGQELWLRGYIFPRQELVYGRSTWVVHGLLWTAWYLFLPWQFVRYLPVALAIGYLAQHRQNTWPGMLAHFAMYVPTLGRLFSRVIEN